jgi:HEAT repeat protein
VLPLGLLSLRPVTPELRSEVLETIKPLLAAQHPMVASMAAENFAVWADKGQLAELQRLATSTDPTYMATRRKALKTLIAIQTSALDPAVVSSLDDFLFSYDIQQALTAQGAEAEKLVLQSWPNVTTGPGKRALIEVLGDVGSAASLPLLESLATSTDREVRIPAALAVDKIRSRR